MENEEWKKIPDWDYEVSDQGRVRSLNYRKKEGNVHILKPIASKTCNYYKVGLHKDKIYKQILIHRTVAQAFPEICGEWFEGCVINHLNRNTYDNRAENLRVCTQYENIHWDGAFEKMKKSLTNHPDLSCPVAQYTLDGKLIAEHLSMKEAERQTGVCTPNIYRCCIGERKTAGGYIWRYI